MNLQQDEYVGVLSRNAGVRIVLKDQREMPFPAEEGVTLAPGLSAHIGIRKVSSLAVLAFSFVFV